VEQFDFAFHPSVDRALIQDLATGRFIHEPACVLIAGPCGTGKSHLAQALGYIGARLGHDVLFTTQSQLLGALNAARATGSFERHFQTLARTALLIIDDFGLKPLRPPQDEDSHDLIAERYDRPPPSSPATSTSPSGAMPSLTACSAPPPWIACAMVPTAWSSTGPATVPPDPSRKPRKHPLPRAPKPRNHNPCSRPFSAASRRLH